MNCKHANKRLVEQPLGVQPANEILKYEPQNQKQKLNPYMNHILLFDTVSLFQLRPIGFHLAFDVSTPPGLLAPVGLPVRPHHPSPWPPTSRLSVGVPVAVARGVRVYWNFISYMIGRRFFSLIGT